MKNLRVTALAGVIAALATGCHYVRMSDDIKLELDFTFLFFQAPHDHLHEPYVRGARLALFIDTDLDDDLRGWRIVSSRPEVLSVEVDSGAHTFTARALGEGTTRLQVLDAAGHVRHEREVRVAVPDRALLHSHGPLLLRGSLEEARVEEARILEGGEATFLVRYYRGEEPLSGNGALSVAPTAGVTAEPRTTFLFENQEWLSLRATAAGARSIELQADGVPVKSFPVVIVAESAIDHVVLAGEDESRAREHEWLNVVAEGRDASGRTILGTEYQWALGGEVQGNTYGDLFRYEYLPGTVKSLVAQGYGKTARATLHAGEGYVTSTNRLGCGAAPGAAGAFGAPLVLALLWMRRRRRRTE